MAKDFRIIILSLFFLVILGLIYFIGSLQPGIEKQLQWPVSVDVVSGEGFFEISKKLYSAGLVRSKKAFEIYSIITGSFNSFQSGRYKFDSSVSVSELVKILTKGPQEISITIIPGMTLKEVDDVLAEAGVIDKNVLINYNKTLEVSLEGFLLPDTYRFYQNSEIGFVVKKILDNFDSKIKDLTSFNDDDSLIKLLKIASYLEKEIPDNDEERRLAAGIFEKRLKIGMPLQIDATVIYAKCEGKFLGCSILTREDFKINSLYNTYFYTGLTPTPIGNPSLSAIKSAFYKKDSQYLYYLSDPKTKKTIFSKDFEEHNRNRVKYLLNNK